MPIAGFGKSHIRYDMFDLTASANEAKRLTKCEQIYHRGQELAWDGREILPMLLEKHGGIRIDDAKRQALEQIFAIIMWGELAAWRISAQLADQLVPLEAKMAATSQAHDEARHFYVMHDYLKELGYLPRRMDRAPQALLDLVLSTDNLAHKLVGMQLMVETMALTIFQTVRETEAEPVLCDLLRYFERDEARHVGLGMQYLPQLMKSMSKRELGGLITFQCRILFWSLLETKVLEPNFKVLGIQARTVIERARRKQVAANQEAFAALGVKFGDERNPVLALLNASVELFFPADENRHSRWSRLKAAVRSMRGELPEVSLAEFDVHAAHEIKTARGAVADGERVSA